MAYLMKGLFFIVMDHIKNLFIMIFMIMEDLIINIMLPQALCLDTIENNVI